MTYNCAARDRYFQPSPPFLLQETSEETMDFQLTEQQRRMVTAVRELAQGEFKANAQKYMDGTFPGQT